MAHLVIFQGKTEQFDERADAETMVAHLKAAQIEYDYGWVPGAAKPKKHKCKDCEMTHYTYQQALECCK